MVNKNLYGLLAKYPEAGKVKTRLASDIGAEGAAEIYRVIAERVFVSTSPVADADFGRVIFYSPLEAKARFEQWLTGEKLILQKGGDIGEIMCNAIKDLLEAGASKAVITGVDIPDINSDVIRDAFLRLENADVVIGPAEDGGYYLIGMKAMHPVIFKGISWSTEKVFEETVRIIESMRLSYSTVKKLSDVDRKEDITGIRDLLSGNLA